MQVQSQHRQWCDGDAVIRMNGTDYITFNGIDVAATDQESNTDIIHSNQVVRMVVNLLLLQIA